MVFLSHRTPAQSTWLSCVAIRARQAGHARLVVSAVEWVARLAVAYHAPLQQDLVQLCRYPLLVVGEVGYIPFDPELANPLF
ncbi:hypothetical protein JHV666_18240 [Mycobacterium avium subsp. hominissuis]|uniref:hypothetical protein n=1 Tax=Mycobacterium avium TaxID=1764 RepID=UPI00191C9029|nr:hypothetical protein [Mycobacterium avium]QWY63835.1 hypothetical protein BJP74_25590 [Mycobacterium avium subsp. hominissuis]